jgi:hypothetical protein
VIVVVMVVIAVVAVVITIPTVVVLDAAMSSVPVARIELLTIVVRPYPMRSFIGWTCPVAVMPPIVVSDGIPIAFDPHEFRSRSRRHHMNDARPWRRSDPDSE